MVYFKDVADQWAHEMYDFSAVSNGRFVQDDGGLNFVCYRVTQCKGKIYKLNKHGFINPIVNLQH